MASDDSDSSPRAAAPPRYRSLRMSAAPQRPRCRTRRVRSPRAPAPVPPPPVVPEKHPVEAPPAPVDPNPMMPRALPSILPVAPPTLPPTLTWEGAEEAPIARTMGNGPAGRMVVGWLRTAAGFDDINIVCFCHGAPFSPVGFLQHAGADDLSYPMRRIFVSYTGLGGAGTTDDAGDGGSGGQQ